MERQSAKTTQQEHKTSNTQEVVNYSLINSMRHEKNWKQAPIQSYFTAWWMSTGTNNVSLFSSN